MINTKMDLFMHRTQIQGRIEYVDNTVNTEPRRAIAAYYEEIYKYIGNKTDTYPGDL